ncbi:MAG: lytic transglycosylase domain-containing protein [Moorellaceae bacterium]
MRSYRRSLLLIFLLVAAVIVLFKPAARLFYPLAYRDTVFSYAQANGLDPLLVMAVMRTESKFYPLAVSATGARGLMQLMPETAQWVAARLKIEFQPERLFEPEFNLLLGTWYLAYLLREFNGNLGAALAAYNGGKENVKEWLQSGVWSGSPADLQKIPFSETREFVYQVLRDYRVYRLLYPEFRSGSSM